jgi:flagellar biosynthetic protein FliO
MKIILQSLMVLMLFLAPSYGQFVAIPSVNEGETTQKDTVKAAKSTKEVASIDKESAVEETAETLPQYVPLVNDTAGDDIMASVEKTDKVTPLEMKVDGIESAGVGLDMIRTIGGFGIVVCLMIVAYFAARKFAPRYFSKGASAKNLKVVETLSMGDKRSISIIEVANNRFLVGNTLHQINLLAALSEPVSFVSKPEPLPEISQDSTPNESGSPFRNLFEVEKKRPSQRTGNPLPEDVRAKMRQLREALER